MAEDLVTYGNGHYIRRGRTWYYAATQERVPEGRDLRIDKRLVMQAPELHPEALLTSVAAAAHCRVTPGTWRQFVSRGDAPTPVLRLGHSPFWTKGVLDAWLASRGPARGRRRRALA